MLEVCNSLNYRYFIRIRRVDGVHGKPEFQQIHTNEKSLFGMQGVHAGNKRIMLEKILL
jgi:hypothetical protein